MKYSNLFIIASAVIIISLTGCNFDVNTSDPQESPNILQSKKSKLFLAQYELMDMAPPVFEIKEAWMEKSWKWKTNYGFKEKVETGRYQLNLLLHSFIDTNFKNNEYGLKWKMENELNGYFRSSGNVYTISIKKLIIPDTLNILIEQMNEDRTTKYSEHFTLKKK